MHWQGVWIETSIIGQTVSFSLLTNKSIKSTTFAPSQHGIMKKETKPVSSYSSTSFFSKQEDHQQEELRFTTKMNMFFFDYNCVFSNHDFVNVIVVVVLLSDSFFFTCFVLSKESLLGFFFFMDVSLLCLVWKGWIVSAY